MENSLASLGCQQGPRSSPRHCQPGWVPPGRAGCRHCPGLTCQNCSNRINTFWRIELANALPLVPWAPAEPGARALLLLTLLEVKGIFRPSSTDARVAWRRGEGFHSEMEGSAAWWSCTSPGTWWDSPWSVHDRSGDMEAEQPRMQSSAGRGAA